MFVPKVGSLHQRVVAHLGRRAAGDDLAAGAGFGIAIWALATKLAGVYSPRGWVSTVGVILFIGGVQLLILGVIGEYLSRVYDEVRQRPLYIVRSRLGFGARESDTAHREPELR